MAKRKSNMSALYFPAELSLADTNCVVCQDDARKPVFCTTCKKMICFECIMRCEVSAGCPTCRGQIQRDVMRNQSKLYSCEEHDLLLTMLCTDCEICVCKQCLGKDAEHAKHSFVSIDSIRADLVQAMDKLYEYMNLVDGFNGLGNMRNIGGELAEKYFTFSTVLQANIDKIRSTVAEVEGYNLKNLIKNRKDIKILLQSNLNELDQMNEPEPREIHDFEVFPLEVNPKPSGYYHYVYTSKFNDSFGNRWKVNFMPTYRVLFGASKSHNCAFALTLKSGIPGRYEVKVEAEIPKIKFEKVFEIYNVSTRSATHMLEVNSEFSVFQALTISIRPTNFKYHLQCLKLYQELITKPSTNIFEVVYAKIEPTNSAETSKTFVKFVKDKTGTQWRIQLCITFGERFHYFRVQLEHYDGAVGRYEFFVEYVDPNDETRNIKYSACHKFGFGSAYCIRKFAKLHAAHSLSVVFKVGIRPATELTGTKRVREEAHRMLRKLAGNG